MFGLWGNKAKEEPKSRDYKESYDRYKTVKEMQRKEKDISERWKKMMSNISTKSPTASAGDLYIDPNTLTTSVYTGSNWTSIDTSTTISSPLTVNPSTGIQIEGDLTVNGRNVIEELDIIKTLLDGAVLQRDPAMEEEFGKLKALADEYQKQLEKYKTFKALKESA